MRRRRGATTRASSSASSAPTRRRRRGGATSTPGRWPRDAQVQTMARRFAVQPRQAHSTRCDSLRRIKSPLDDGEDALRRAARGVRGIAWRARASRAPAARRLCRRHTWARVCGRPCPAPRATSGPGGSGRSWRGPPGLPRSWIRAGLLRVHHTRIAEPEAMLHITCCRCSCLCYTVARCDQQRRLASCVYIAVPLQFRFIFHHYVVVVDSELAMATISSDTCGTWPRRRHRPWVCLRRFLPIYRWLKSDVGRIVTWTRPSPGWGSLGILGSPFF